MKTSPHRTWMFLSLLALVLLLSGNAFGQACTHYASANGSGSSCSIGTPCLINSFWSISSLPGKVLCLNNGTYTGGNSMITPPAGVRGTSGNPITVRALNDGQVLLDAEHDGFAINLGWHGGPPNSNDWFVVDGINATNGLEATINISSADSIGQRLVGYHGTDQQDDANIFRMRGFRSRFVDCAGWGHNSRKIFDGAQSGNLDGAGWKRCWGEWNDWSGPLEGGGGSQPTLTYQFGYNTTDQLCENCVGTWNTTGNLSPTHEGVFRAFRARNPNDNYDSEGMRVLGSIFYIRSGSSYPAGEIFLTEYISNFYAEDVVARVDSGHTGVAPFYFDSGCTGGCSGNVCSNCLAIHSGRPSVNTSGSGMSLPNFRQGNGLAAATGGTSAFVLLPGICKRYENGALTNTPLWPWPMNQRILDARVASGFSAVNVTTEIESILGTIPTACRSDSGDGTTPEVSITAPTNGAGVSGSAVSVTATATDNVGVVGVQFKLDGVNLSAEDTTAPYAIVWNSALSSNGSHTLTAVARDAAGNTATSAGITVTVSGGVETTISISPTTIVHGGSVTATWANIITPDEFDWIGLFTPGAANTAFITFVYLDPSHVTALANGSLSYPIPGSLAPGTYELRLFAQDVFILLDISEPLTVTADPDGVAPTVSITSPVNGATLSGSAVPITATASDNVGVVGVQFKLDGVNLGAEDTNAPYTVNWNTTLTTNDSHNLTAVARDAAGNTTTSSTVAVAVNNLSGVYYVSTTGSNSNNGLSPGTAWATLQYAHDTVVAGDTINVLAGQYYQRVTLTKANLTWTGQVGTIIDGTDALTGWSSQGSGMYRVAYPGYAPGALVATAAVLTIGRMQDSFMAGSYLSCGVTGLQALQTSSSFTCGGVPYWDGWEAGWGNNGGFVYMRFRGGQNPNSMLVRSAPNGPDNAGTFTFAGADNNIIQDMEIGAATNAIYMRNASNNNIVRNCYLRNGPQQVLVEGNSSGNLFENNNVQVRWIGATAGYASFVVPEGNWNHATYGDGRLFQYNHDKFEGADGSEHTGGFMLNGDVNTTIRANIIQGGTVGINMEQGSGTVIEDNYLSNCSAECVYFSGSSSLTMGHNVLYDGSHLIRIQRMEYSGKTGYFYRNHWHQDFEGAKHVHFSFIERIPSTNTLYFYHNTFTGAGWAADCGCGDSGTIASMANVRYVNNLLTGPEMDISSFGLNGNPGTTGYVGMWSYNHCSNGCTVTGSNNYVSNTTGGTNPIWSDPRNDVLLPPSGHAALNSAIRLDQNWTIGGTTRSALPGMTGGYYPDSTPHKGSWQEDETIDPDPPDPPAPSANITGSGGRPSRRYGRYGGFKIPEEACNMDCQQQRRWEQIINDHRGKREELVGALESLRDHIFRD